MTSGDLIEDLSARIIRGRNDLLALRDAVGHDTDRARLAGKIEGLGLVLDWMRSYPNEETT